MAIYPLVGVVLASLYPSGPAELAVGLRAAPDVRLAQLRRRRGEQGGFASSFTTSLIVAVVMVPASVGLSVVAGYAFATMKFRGSKVLFYLFILGLIIPTEATIVPLYYDVQAIGLLDTYWALILLEVSGELAFGIFWMRAAFLSAPPSLLEAARIDGASSWKTLWRIMVPFARPAILTLAVLTFADSWNEFFLALVFTINHMTAPAGLASFSGRYTTERPAGVGRRGDRRGPDPDRLHLLPARVHARHADRRGEGLSDGTGGLRGGRRSGSARSTALQRLLAGRSRTASSWCSSVRRARARPRRCGWSPGSRR